MDLLLCKWISQFQCRLYTGTDRAFADRDEGMSQCLDMGGCGLRNTCPAAQILSDVVTVSAGESEGGGWRWWVRALYSTGM